MPHELPDGTFKSPVHEMMNGSYYYEDSSVGKSRKDKWCSLCPATIPKGSAVQSVKIFCDEWYDHPICDKCLVTYAKEISDMRNGELDDY